MRFFCLFFLLIVAMPLPTARAESPPSPEPILRIEPAMHTGTIKRIGVSADGRLLATGSRDKTVRLWSLPVFARKTVVGGPQKTLKPKLIRTLRVPIGPGNDGKIFALALSPDGRTVAAGGWDAYSTPNGGNRHYIYLFDTVTGALTGRLGPLKNVINNLAFSKDGKQLAAGLGDHGVLVWQVNNQQLLLKSRSFGDVYGLDFDQKGRLVATSLDGFVRLYAPLLPPPSQRKTIGSPRLSPSPIGAGSGWGAGVLICDAVPKLNTGPPHPSPLPSIKKEEGEGVRGTDPTSSSHLEKQKTAKKTALPPCYRLMAKKKAPGGEKPSGIAFSPDGSLIALGYYDSTSVDVLDGLNLEKKYSADTKGLNNGDLSKVAWSLDGQSLFAAGTYDVDGENPILRWKDKGRGKRQSLPGPLNTVHDLVALANGALVFGSGDPAFGVLSTDGAQSLYQGPVTVDTRGKIRQHFTLSREAQQVRFGLKYGGKSSHLFDLAALRLTSSNNCRTPPVPSPLGAWKEKGIGDGAPISRPRARVRGTELVCGTVPKSNTGTPHPNPLPSGEREKERSPQPSIKKEEGEGEGEVGLHQADTTSLPIKDWLNKDHPTLNGKPLKLKQYERSRSLAIAPDKKSFVLGTEWSLRRFDASGKQLWRKQVPGVVWGVNLSADGRIIVAAYGDGTIRWHRASDGAELLALFIHVPDKSWVLWTPSGYYTASPGGEELIGWHVNRGWDEAADFFPASKFRKRFYRPDVIKLILDTLDEKKALEAANKLAGIKSRNVKSIAKSLPPVIDILSRITDFNKRTLTIEYNLRSPSRQKILNVEVLIDGRPWKGRGLVPSELQIRPGRHKITVELPPRDVNVALVARTRESSSVRTSLALTWTGEKVKQVELPRLFALLIGISDYKDDSLDLNYADDDAIALDKFFRAQEGRTYRKVTTKLLTDKEASRGNILRQLNWLRKQAKAGDVVIISMAGHGYTDATQFFHFLAYETDPSEPTINGISNANLTAMIARITAKVVVFIDACHAGDGVTSTVNMSRMSGEMKEANVIFYAASTGTQLSQESAEWGHGAFTYALLQGLSGSADYDREPPKGIDTAELNLWLGKKVARLTNGAQQPIMIKSKVPDFVLASGN